MRDVVARLHHCARLFHIQSADATEMSLKHASFADLASVGARSVFLVGKRPDLQHRDVWCQHETSSRRSACPLERRQRQRLSSSLQGHRFLRSFSQRWCNTSEPHWANFRSLFQMLCRIPHGHDCPPASQRSPNNAVGPLPHTCSASSWQLAPA